MGSDNVVFLEVIEWFDESMQVSISATAVSWGKLL